MISILAIAVVAIVDTGVRCAHLQCLDGYDNRNDGMGHGTIVATIAQQTCPSCKILPVKIYDKGRIDVADLERGLRWVKRWKQVHKRASLVVNLSMQTRDRLPVSLRKVIRDIKRLGVPVVAAAGNGGLNTLKIPEVLLVGSLDSTGQKKSWSNDGDLYTVAQEFPDAVFQRGTSYSAPVVSAILARGKKANETH